MRQAPVRALCALLALAVMRGTDAAQSRFPPLFVEGEPVLSLSESTFYGIVAGCFGLGVVFGIVYVVLWRVWYSRQRPPSLFVAKERWVNTSAYEKVKKREITPECVIL